MNEPRRGTIYRRDGDLLMYVRTEQRPGCPEPEHLFVKTEGRTVFQVWTRVVPPEAELIVDTGGRREAEEQRWLTLVAEHEKGILAELLQTACGWLPAERARELRQRWRDRQPPESA